MSPCTLCGILASLLHYKIPLGYAPTAVPLQGTYATLLLDNAATNVLLNL